MAFAPPRRCVHSRTATRIITTVALLAAGLVAVLTDVGTAIAQTSQPNVSTAREMRLVHAIDAWRDVPNKLAKSTGPLKAYAGIYSRGHRCEIMPGPKPEHIWVKAQFVLWTDEEHLYGMQLKSSPAVFQFAYAFLWERVGARFYRLTRLDGQGEAAGVVDQEWHILGVDMPRANGKRLGINIPDDFAARPDVHAVTPLTLCSGDDQKMALDSAIGDLRYRLSALPSD